MSKRTLGGGRVYGAHTHDCQITALMKNRQKQQSVQRSDAERLKCGQCNRGNDLNWIALNGNSPQVSKALKHHFQASPGLWLPLPHHARPAHKAQGHSPQGDSHKQGGNPNNS